MTAIGYAVNTSINFITTSYLEGFLSATFFAHFCPLPVHFCPHKQRKSKKKKKKKKC